MKAIRFSAIWCAGCLVMKSRWDKVFSKYPDIEIVDYDYDINHEEVNEYNIGKIIPVIILMNNNQEIKRIIGEKSVDELDTLLGELYE
jgi:thiol-disulfide isomerase/thioredoxin